MEENKLENVEVAQEEKKDEEPKQEVKEEAKEEIKSESPKIEEPKKDSPKIEEPKKECKNCCECHEKILMPNTGIDFKNPKKIEDLNLIELFLWRNYILSLIVLVAGNLFYILIKKYQFTFVTLFGRVALFTAMGGMIAALVMKLMKKDVKKEDIPFVKDFEIKEECCVAFVKSFVMHLNCFINKLIDIVLLKCPKKSIMFIVKVQILCMIGKRVSGIQLFYLALNFAFTVPKIYEFGYDFINKYAKILGEKIHEQMMKIKEKIPPQYVEMLEKYCGKCDKCCECSSEKKVEEKKVEEKKVEEVKKEETNVEDNKKEN